MMDCFAVAAMMAYNGLACVFVRRFNTTFDFFCRSIFCMLAPQLPPALAPASPKVCELHASPTEV
jgi:hypothetical protein